MEGGGAPALTVNQRFVRLCLRSRWDPVALSEAEGLAGEVDWPRLCADARGEGLAPLLYAAVRGWSFVPDAALADLLLAYQESALYSAVMSVELAALLDLLSEARLPAIVLKGAALGDTLYGNAALRPMTDLDLLLHREDVPAAQQALEARGYHRSAVEARPGLTLAFENEIVLRSAGTPALAVELHWRLLDSPFYQERVDEGWFWETARPAEVAGTQALVLGLEAAFLHLSAHYVLHHQGRGDRWIHDIALLTARRGTAIDWDGLLARAASFDLVTSVQTVLHQLVSDWQAAIPDHVMDAADRLPISAAERQVVDWLLSAQRPVVQRFWADLASIGDRRQRWTYLLANLFPSAAYMQDRYGLPGRALIPLAYPYRWLTGAREAFASRRQAGERDRGDA